MRSFLLSPMLGQAGRRDAAGRASPAARWSSHQLDHQSSALFARQPRRAGDAGRVDQAVDREHLVARPRRRGLPRCADLGSARALAPLSEPTPLSDAGAPALKHALADPDRLAHHRGSPCSKCSISPAKPILAQVVSQIARVKMPPLAVPGKNGITQLLELPDRANSTAAEFFLDHLEQLRMHHHRPTQLALDEALARGNGRREARRADAGLADAGDQLPMPPPAPPRPLGAGLQSSEEIVEKQPPERRAPERSRASAR